MKRLSYILMLVSVVLFASCSDELDTAPSDKVAAVDLFKDVESASAVINGVYRMMYYSGWSQNWAPENAGQVSVTLVANLMADDHIMRSAGSGWYYYDYSFDTRQDYLHRSGHQYGFWNLYYTMISNINAILHYEQELAGDEKQIKNLMAQAYAMRAFAYHQLVQIFSTPVNANPDAPGIPVYTEITNKDSEGKPRGTVKQVYDLINADIAKAITLFDEANVSRKHISHVNINVAYALKARIDMSQDRWADAAEAAGKALSVAGGSTYAVQSVANYGGFNDAKSAGVMWASEINADQTSGWASFFSILDADVEGTYAARAQHQISNWLYNQIPVNDARLGWWNGLLPAETGGSNVNYGQKKFRFRVPATRQGDYIHIRAEEMVLIRAEAYCHLENFVAAREEISKLGERRMAPADYQMRLEQFTNSKVYNTNTVGDFETLMDEILFQRRVELWGEGTGRLFDLQRLGLGFSRAWTGNNHTARLTTIDTSAGSKMFIQPLPQSEIDGNSNISVNDQNPI